MRSSTHSNRDFHSLTEIIEQTIRESGGEHVSVDRIIASFGHASFVPLLILPALVLITPLSGVPGLSTVCGLTIMLIAVQQLVGHKRVWLPGWIRRREVETERLHTAMRKTLPLTRLIDSTARERLTFLFKPPLLWLLPLACVIFGAIMPVMEFIPFSSSLIGVAVTLIAFSILTRDGIFALVALVPVGIVIWGMSALLSSL